MYADYGSFDEITHAAKSAKDINETSIQNNLYITEPVDLLIRTGGNLDFLTFIVAKCLCRIFLQKLSGHNLKNVI